MEQHSGRICRTQSELTQFLTSNCNTMESFWKEREEQERPKFVRSEEDAVKLDILKKKLREKKFVTDEENE